MSVIRASEPTKCTVFTSNGDIDIERYAFDIAPPMNGTGIFEFSPEVEVVCNFHNGIPHGQMVVIVDDIITMRSQYYRGYLYGDLVTYFRTSPDIVSSLTVWNITKWISSTLFNKEANPTESVTIVNDYIYVEQYEHTVDDEITRDAILSKISSIARPTYIFTDGKSVEIIIPKGSLDKFRSYRTV